jgi:hypothetical protein
MNLDLSKGVEAVAKVWAKLPEDVRTAVTASVAEGLDTTLVVLSARLATTEFAQKHESFDKVLGKVIGFLRGRLHGGK